MFSKDFPSNHIAEPRFSLKEAAAILHMGRTTLWREVTAGRVGFYLIRGRKQIGQSHIEGYLANAEVRAASGRGVR